MNAGESFIQVKPGKKVVKLINLGGSPFHIDKKSDAIIPNNLQVETYYQKFNLIASTRVVESQDTKFTNAEFQFKTETVQGGWFLNPSRALKDFVMKAGGEWKPSTDGRLIFGVTYPPIQKLVHEKFSLQLANKVEATTTTTPTPVVVSTTPAKPTPTELSKSCSIANDATITPKSLTLTSMPPSTFQVMKSQPPRQRLHHQTICERCEVNDEPHELLPPVKRPRIVPEVFVRSSELVDVNNATPSVVAENNSGLCRLLEVIAEEDQLAISSMMASPL